MKNGTVTATHLIGANAPARARALRDASRIWVEPLELATAWSTVKCHLPVGRSTLRRCSLRFVMSGGTPEADSWPAFAARERVRCQREIDELHARYGDLCERITAILFQHNPVRLNFDDNTDEYEPEARRVVWALSTLGSVGEARRTIRDGLPQRQRRGGPGSDGAHS